MISSWRTSWGQSDFPFAFVQLANYMTDQSSPIEVISWADLRESQAAALALPNTSMATIIDIGAENDIHPKDKLDVGIRLALPILAKVYGKHVIYSGPMYHSMSVEHGKIAVTFDFADVIARCTRRQTLLDCAGAVETIRYSTLRRRTSMATELSYGRIKSSSQLPCAMPGPTTRFVISTTERDFPPIRSERMPGNPPKSVWRTTSPPRSTGPLPALLRLTPLSSLKWRTRPQGLLMKRCA